MSADTLLGYLPVIVGFLAAAGGALWDARRRYLKFAGRELQPFSAYVAGSLRLTFGRRFRPALARQFGLRQYAGKALTASRSKLTVPNMPDAPLDIDKTYVRLSLSGGEAGRVADDTLLGANTGAVLLFGEPGSGKSSLTLKLFREACKRAAAEPRNGRLPIRIELGKVGWDEAPGGEASAEWLLETIAKKVRAVHDPAFVYAAFADGPGLIVFLDGLDEVPASRLGAAAETIRLVTERLRMQSEGTAVIVTGRTQLRHTLPRDFAASFQSVYKLERFTTADMFALLRRWPFDGDRLAETTRILRDLRAHPPLSEMCSTPLILAMYIAFDQQLGEGAGQRSVRLPDTRPAFYQKVVDELLLYRREEKIPTRTAGSALQKARAELLSRLALEHLMDVDESQNTIGWPRAVQLMMEVLGYESFDEAESALRQMSEDTGIFTEERKGEVLVFMHLTICEYLAARQVVQTASRTLPVVLRSVSSDSEHGRRLWETAIFALAMLRDEEVAPALSKLKASGASSELLLRSIREAQAYSLDVFREIATDAITALTAADESEWDDSWFTRLRLLSWCLDEAERLSAIRRIVVVTTTRALLDGIVDSREERFASLFDMYLREDPVEAVRLAELSTQEPEVIHPSKLVPALEDPTLVDVAIREIESRPDIRRVWAASLVEAALRYEMVANTLFDTKELPPTIQRLVAGTAGTWYDVGPLKGTLYGALAALAVAEAGPIEEEWENGLPGVALLASTGPDVDVTKASTMLASRTSLATGLMAGTVMTGMTLVMSMRLLDTFFLQGLGIGVAVLFGFGSGLLARGNAAGWSIDVAWLPETQTELHRLIFNLDQRRRSITAERVVLWLGGAAHVAVSTGSSDPPSVIRVVVGGSRQRAYRAQLEPPGGQTTSLVRWSSLQQVAVVIGSVERLEIVHTEQLTTQATWRDRLAPYRADASVEEPGAVAA